MKCVTKDREIWKTILFEIAIDDWLGHGFSMPLRWLPWHDCGRFVIAKQENQNELWAALAVVKQIGINLKISVKTL